MGIAQLIIQNRNNFLAFNQVKYQHFQDLLPNTKMRNTLNCIPLLLSMNHPKLPGYVQGDFLYGVAKYQPTDDLLRFFKSKFYGVSLELNENDNFVEMVALIGSVGTVAYNKKSDFDYWVCVDRKRCTSEANALFLKKVEGIQQWAEKQIDRPVHLFVNDIDSIKDSIFAEDDEEAFGSTIGELLKDEFYRSSIIVAGKMPFWWVVPKFADNQQYEKIWDDISLEEKENYYLDLGNLYQISSEDFLGAALFQLIKSLGNPFKSIIKLGLLEKYLFGEDDTALICQKVKMRIQQNKCTSTHYDGYLIMFSEVFDYYSYSLADKTQLNVLCKNFYLKIDPQLSKYSEMDKNLPYKVTIMRDYVEAWGWTDDFIKELDDFEDWDYNKVNHFWNEVQYFMLQSYQKISARYTNVNLQNKVSESDFKIITRKIHSHFSKQPGKIETFVTFKDEAFEPVLYLEPESQGATEINWQVYKSTINKENYAKTLIKVDKDILNLLVWIAINKIYAPDSTRINVKSGYSRIDSDVIIDLLNNITTHFNGDGMKVKNSYLTKEVFSLKNMLIVDFNDSQAEDIKRILFLSYTSWGEFFLNEYPLKNIPHLLCKMIQDANNLHCKFSDYSFIHIPKDHFQVYKGIEQMFKGAYSFLLEEKRQNFARFIADWRGQYFMLTKHQDQVVMSVYHNFRQFGTALSLKPLPFCDYKYYSNYSDELTLFNDLEERITEDHILVTYEKKGKYVYLYLRDENHNLYFYLKHESSLALFWQNIYQFIFNSLALIKKVNIVSLLQKNDVKFLEIRRDRRDYFEYSDQTDQITQDCLAHGHKSSFLRVQVLLHKKDEILYNFFFADKTKSGWISVNSLTDIVKKILEERKAGRKMYPLISEIRFGDLNEDDLLKGSSLYFAEKQKLELLLEQALKKMV